MSISSERLTGICKMWMCFLRELGLPRKVYLRQNPNRGFKNEREREREIIWIIIAEFNRF